jgi:TrmH family RNA methyltransferase
MYSVIFVEPEEQGNLGGLARAMANFGLSELVLVNPGCRPGRDAVARAKHGADILARARVVRDFRTAVAGFDAVIGTTARTCHDYDAGRPCISLREFASIERPCGRLALAFGRESSGLTNSELALCDAVITIPANPRYPVLNVSHAAAIVFYELASQKESRVRKADAKERETLNRLFARMVDGLPGIRDRQNVKKVFANVTGRSIIAGREAHTLAGALARADRYLNRGVQKKGR